jgi:ribosomal 30S subunit maturation factor RimM
MGIIPATGTEIAMGKVRNAYGLTGQVALRATLGAQIGITTGQIRLSIDFGGKTTPNNYA